MASPSRDEYYCLIYMGDPRHKVIKEPVQLPAGTHIRPPLPHCRDVVSLVVGLFLVVIGCRRNPGVGAGPSDVRPSSQPRCSAAIVLLAASGEGRPEPRPMSGRVGSRSCGREVGLANPGGQAEVVQAAVVAETAVTVGRPRAPGRPRPAADRWPARPSRPAGWSAGPRTGPAGARSSWAAGSDSRPVGAADGGPAGPARRRRVPERGVGRGLPARAGLARPDAVPVAVAGAGAGGAAVPVAARAVARHRASAAGQGAVAARARGTDRADRAGRAVGAVGERRVAAAEGQAAAVARRWPGRSRSCPRRRPGPSG